MTAAGGAPPGSALSSAGRETIAPLPANPRDFNGLFQVEAATRPVVPIKIEDVLSAFKGENIDVPDAKQHLGRPFGARYCVGGTAAKLVAISVCEYIDDTAVKDGVEGSRKIQLANREIRINKTTSLTTREIAKTPETDALVARLYEIFAKLH